jgi:hypothetical protein
VTACASENSKLSFFGVGSSSGMAGRASWLKMMNPEIPIAITNRTISATKSPACLRIARVTGRRPS